MSCSLIYSPWTDAEFRELVYEWQKHVQVREGCWGWTGGVFHFGHGHIQKFLNGRNRGFVASRVSYTLHHGPVPKGASVLHSCDRPECTNPMHLRLGDARDNTRDMYSRNRGPQAKTTAEQRRELVQQIKAGVLSQSAAARLAGIRRESVRDWLRWEDR